MGKDKLLRFKEMKEFKNVFQPGFREVYQNEYKLKGKWAAEYFKNTNPIVLELGCGKGEYTVGLAQRNPNVNFIGIDIKGARIWRGAKTALEKDLKNAAFVRSSIDLVPSIFGKNEIDEIWLTFSDPQPKKPRKRLSSSLFLNRYLNFLKPNGIIHLKTDSKLLFEYTNALAEENKFFINFISRDIYADNQLPEPVAGIQTFYEKQFLGEGKKIHYLEFKVTGNKEIAEPKEFEEPERQVH